MAESIAELPTDRPPLAGPREARPPPARMRRPPAARVAVAQGAWLLGLGLLPLVERMARRPAGWLTKGVPPCLASVGAALAFAGARGRVSREVRILGLTTALSFAAMDAWYAGIRRRASPLHLLTAAAQLGFAAAWGYAQWRESLDLRRLPEAAFA
jgi:hypothetical protein